MAKRQPERSEGKAFWVPKEAGSRKQSQVIGERGNYHVVHGINGYKHQGNHDNGIGAFKNKIANGVSI